jgi:hypothetical protein
VRGAAEGVPEPIEAEDRGAGENHNGATVGQDIGNTHFPEVNCRAEQDCRHCCGRDRALKRWPSRQRRNQAYDGDNYPAKFDAKLSAFGGALVGIALVLPALLVGSLTALPLSLILMVTRRINRKTLMPFGPFLAFGFVLVVLLGGSVFTD